MLKTMGDLFRDNAQKFPEKLAIKYADREITFGAHFLRAQQLASALYQVGLRRQDRLAVLSQNSPEYLELYGCAELSGYIVTTINFRLIAPEIEYLLSSSQPKILFFERQYAAVVESLRTKFTCIEKFICLDGRVEWAESYEDFMLSGSVDGAPIQSRATDVLHLMYTSGTTGRPKGVMLSQESGLRNAETWSNEIGIKIDDRFQLMMPLFHVGSRWLQIATHYRSAAIVLHREFVPESIVQTMEREKITMSLMAPTMIQAVLETPAMQDCDLSALHTICYSAAPMPVPLLRRGIERLGNIFLQVYAMTECGGTTLHKHQHVVDGSPRYVRRLASVGQAIKTVGLRLVDQEGEAVPQGSVGEIVLHSEARLLGYWNDSIATLQALRDGWYYTGDMGRLDEDGFLYLVDRKKDIIISGGENISSLEVENVLCQHTAVAAAAVVAQPDQKWGESPCAFIELRAGMQTTEAELKQFCQEHLARFKIPKRVVFREIPRTTTGKYQKFILRQWLTEQSESS